jgi:hypothetical protein
LENKRCSCSLWSSQGAWSLRAKQPGPRPALPAPTCPGRKSEPGRAWCSEGKRRRDVREKTSRSRRGRCPCNGTERSDIRGSPSRETYGLRPVGYRFGCRLTSDRLGVPGRMAGQ